MRSVAIWLMLLLGACTAPVETSAAPEIVAIVEPNEAGPSMVVSGRVVDAITMKPVPGAQIIVYQTDQTGTYDPAVPSDESTARIRGELTADAAGRFAFSTVQPGEYPDQPPGNRHIHFHEVAANGYESRTFLLLFDDNVRSEVRSWANETGFGLIADVTGDDAAGLETTIEIELQPKEP